MKWLLFGISCFLLGGCGSSPVVALTSGKPISYWVQAASDPDPKVRKEAVFKLGNNANFDPSVIPALHKALKDTDPRVRCEAILALMKTNSESEKTVVLLSDLEAHDTDSKVRVYAAKGLKKLQVGH
jgi:hypothetical protein